MRDYFYRLLRQYLSLFILPQNSVVEIDPKTALLVAALPNGRVVFRSEAPVTIPADRVMNIENVAPYRPDYIVLGNLLHYERDIQHLLSQTHRLCRPDTRVILTYYSSLW